MPDEITSTLDLWISAAFPNSSVGRGGNNKPDAYGVKKLRELILALAVRGRLVEQDPEENSAGELLTQIASEKARLVKNGLVRKPRDLSNEEALVEPFVIPTIWRWCRLDTIGAIIGGGTPSAALAENFAESGKGVPWLTPADLGRHSGLYIKRGTRDLSEKGLRSSSATLMPAGTVLFSSRAPIGYVGIAANPISTNQGFKSIIPYVRECSRFIAVAMQTFAPVIDANAPGTTFREVSGRIMAGRPFPLPPLAEQRRIVAKVDELMVLCDQVEHKRTHSIETHQCLVEALLGTLTRTTSTQVAAESWTRVASHFDTLFTTERTIDQLEETILQLAVMGMLVPQDPNDEEVQAALARSDRRRREVAASDRRADFHQQPILSAENRWEVPQTWTWRGLADLVLFVDYRGKTPIKRANGVRLLTAKNVRKGQVDLSPEECVSEADYMSWMTRGFPNAGDVLFTTEAPMGNAAVVDLKERFALAQRVICFKGYGAIDPSFLVLQILSTQFQGVLDKNGTGMTAKGIKASKLKRLPIAVPPLIEQRRIVGTVHELMALCSALKARVAEAQTTQVDLADAVVEQVVG